MKPIKLTMRGFMTYKDQIEIDFTKLYPKKIFLISGDTGSGKTTIFDGITYALYGEISRGISGSTLRSDFLSETDPYTFVRLEFELDGKRYMVERIPSQEANKEGKSINLRGNSASFYEIGNEKESLLTKVTEVNNKIIEIMGLDKDQFTKVMLLAQGQFQQFLIADSKVRSKLLGDIFKTHMYEEIQIDLKERAKASANKLEAIYESLKTEVERDEELAANVEIGDIASRKFKPILELSLIHI